MNHSCLSPVKPREAGAIAAERRREITWTPCYLGAESLPVFLRQPLVAESGLTFNGWRQHLQYVYHSLPPVSGSGLSIKDPLL